MIRPPAACEGFKPPHDNDLGDLYRPTAECPYTLEGGCLQSDDVPEDWHCLSDMCWALGLLVRKYLIDRSQWRTAANQTDAVMAAAYDHAKSLIPGWDKPAPLVL